MSFRFTTIYFSSCIPCTCSAPTRYLPSFSLHDCVTLGPSHLPIPRCIHHSVPSICVCVLVSFVLFLDFFSLNFFLFLGFFLLHMWVVNRFSLLLICLQTWKEQSWYMTWISQENLNKVTWPWSSNKSVKKGKFHHRPSATSEAASPPVDGVQLPPFWVSTDRWESSSWISGCLFLFGVLCIPQRNKA